MNKYNKATIIGLWRMGNGLTEIVEVVGYNVMIIEQVIRAYKNKLAREKINS
jgi:3-hydroxyacyl-CoA dehydrogenase